MNFLKSGRVFPLLVLVIFSAGVLSGETIKRRCAEFYYERMLPDYSDTAMLWHVKEGIKDRTAALLDEPQDAMRWKNLGLSFELNHSDALRDSDIACAMYQKAVAVDPQYEPARLGLGHLLLMQGHWKSAEKHLTEGLHLLQTQHRERIPGELNFDVSEGYYKDLLAMCKQASKWDESDSGDR